MSVEQQNPEHPCRVNEGEGKIKMLIQPKQKDLGGFSVRRSLPTKGCRSIGPWVFFDHMGPAEFKAGEGINVRPHPHINLATVTYLFEGEIFHRDSLGNQQAIVPGDINLMVAGRGIVHSERERPEVTAQPHRLHGLQLWLALPEAYEEIEPAFYHYPSKDIPALTIDGVKVRIMMGQAWGVTAPVKTFADTLYIEAFLSIGQSLQLPSAEECAVYVASGTLQLDGVTLPEYSLTVLNPGQKVLVTADKDTRLAVIGGASLGKRYMEWNFVSSQQARIEQAKADWRAQSFPVVPGDEEEYIPLPQ